VPGLSSVAPLEQLDLDSVTIATSTPVTAYSAGSRTGSGNVDLATDFWLQISSNTVAGSYSATATIAVVAGP
jgi:hypothetical protein